MMKSTRVQAQGARGTTNSGRSTRFAANTFLGFALASLCGAQNQAWIRQIGTSQSDWPAAVASDGSGGAYVAGGTSGSLGATNAGQEDAWFARYDDLGNQIWVRQLGSAATDSCNAVASDGSGGCFVAGFTEGGLAQPSLGGWDVWVARYDGSGNQLWIQQFGTNSADALEGMASDGLGGVFVCGLTLGSLGGANSGELDGWIGHIDGTGSVTWLRQLGTSNWDACKGIELDASGGGVFVCGVTNNALGGTPAGLEDAWIAHYTAAGNQTWIRQLGTSESDYALNIAADGSGGVLFGGGTYGILGAANSGGMDAWVARYDGAGNPLWTVQIGTSGNEATGGVIANGTGEIFVSGYTTGDLGGPNAGLSDVWLGSYTNGGTLVSMSQLGTSSNEGAGAIASSSTSLFVVGSSGGAFGGPNAGINDAWIALYDGVVRQRYCAPSNANSTGISSTLLALGSSAVQANDLKLAALQLPANTFGFFLNSRRAGFVANPGGSQGNLCLAGAIGRYFGPGQVLNSGSSGSIALQLDITQTPTPSGFVLISAGQTWNFQAWFRDMNPTPTNNFTDAVSITFY